MFLGLLSGMCAAAALLAGARLPADDRLPSTLSISDGARRFVARLRLRGASRLRPAGSSASSGSTEMLHRRVRRLFVAVAFDQLGRGGSAAALLAAAFAAGALFVAVCRQPRRQWRLTGLITLGTVLLTLPLLFVGQSTPLSVVLLLRRCSAPATH